MFVVKPVTVIRPHVAEVNVPVFVASPTAVAVYLVIVAPPLDAGLVQFTVTDVELATATAPIVGAPGTVAGAAVVVGTVGQPPALATRSMPKKYGRSEPSQHFEPRKPANPPDTRATTDVVVVGTVELVVVVVVGTVVVVVVVGTVELVVVVRGTVVVVVRGTVVVVVVLGTVVVVVVLAGAANHFTGVFSHQHTPVCDNRNTPEYLSTHAKISLVEVG